MSVESFALSAAIEYGKKADQENEHLMISLRTLRAENSRLLFRLSEIRIAAMPRDVGCEATKPMCDSPAMAAPENLKSCPPPNRYGSE